MWKYLSYTTLTAALLSLSACTGTQPLAKTPAVSRVDAQDELINYRTAIRELRDSPYAKLAGADIDRAEGWLQEAQTRMATDDDDDDAKIPLLMKAIHGQIVLVRSFYARREAEDQLEEVRADYEQRTTRQEAP